MTAFFGDRLIEVASVLRIVLCEAVVGIWVIAAAEATLRMPETIPVFASQYSCNGFNLFI